MRLATMMAMAMAVAGCSDEPLPGLGEQFSCASELRCLPDGELFLVEPTVCSDTWEHAYWRLYDVVEAKGAECPNGYDTQWVTCEPAGDGVRRPCDL